MAGTIIVDRIESDASYASTINVANRITFSNTANFVGNGNVSIGTALATSGKLVISGNTVTTSQGIRLGADSADARFICESATLGAGILGTFSAHSQLFYTNSTERMRIDSDGFVGIGNNGPTHKLDVISNVNGPTVRIINQRDTAGSFGIKVTLGSSGGAGTTDSAHFHGNTNAVGNWYLFGNGTTSYSSDQRLKKNIESARDGYLEDLCRLRVVKYNWNASSQSASKEIGLIAQEVEQVFPGLVQDDANPVTEGDDTTYKQLKQSVLPFMLLKAIQELKAINDTQAATITSLTETITALTARVVALEA